MALKPPFLCVSVPQCATKQTLFFRLKIQILHPSKWSLTSSDGVARKSPFLSSFHRTNNLVCDNSSFTMDYKLTIQQAAYSFFSLPTSQIPAKGHWLSMAWLVASHTGFACTGRPKSWCLETSKASSVWISFWRFSALVGNQEPSVLLKNLWPAQQQFPLHLHWCNLCILKFKFWFATCSCLYYSINPFILSKWVDFVSLFCE